MRCAAGPAGEEAALSSRRRGAAAPCRGDGEERGRQHGRRMEESGSSCHLEVALLGSVLRMVYHTLLGTTYCTEEDCRDFVYVLLERVHRSARVRERVSYGVCVCVVCIACMRACATV